MDRPDLIKLERGYMPLRYKKRLKRNLSIFSLVLVFTAIYILYIN